MVDPELSNAIHEIVRLAVLKDLTIDEATKEICEIVADSELRAMGGVPEEDEDMDYDPQDNFEIEEENEEY